MSVTAAAVTTGSRCLLAVEFEDWRVSERGCSLTLTSVGVI